MREENYGLVNKKVLLCYGIISALFIVAYLIEFLKGERTLGYVLTFLGVLILGLAVCSYVFKKEPSSSKVKYAVAIMYLQFYLFTMLTSNTIMTFAYILPIVFLLSIYQDSKLQNMLGASSLVINIAYTVRYIIVNGFDKSDLTNYEIQYAVVIFVAFFSTIAAKTMKTLNDKDMALVKQEQQHVKNTLSDVMNIAGDFPKIVDATQEIDTSSAGSLTAIEEIVAGTTDLANTIQNQLHMTENITKLADDTERLSSRIQEEFAEAHDILGGGKDAVASLQSNSAICIKTAQGVSSVVEKLIQDTRSAQAILAMITEVVDEDLSGIDLTTVDNEIVWEDETQQSKQSEGYAQPGKTTQDRVEEVLNSSVTQHEQLIKLEVAEVLDKQVTKRLSKYDKRRRRKQIFSAIKGVLKLAVAIVVIFILFGSEEQRLQWGEVVDDAKVIVTGLANGEEVTSNELVADICEAFEMCFDWEK
ncbi:MAG: hypothetical protein IJ379_04710 [Lachnospiraceae bacterium]|nr:hypothetical protein [Lachnospiraceae bacterium]